MRPRGNRNSIAVISNRREQVWHLVLRGFTHRQILHGLRKQGLTISSATLKRDVEAVRNDLLATKQASELYSLNMAFTELLELWREAWDLYQRPPAQITTKTGVITWDDRGIKATLIRELRGIIHERAQILGYFTPKVLERLIMYETSQGRGIQIERLTFEEQLNMRVEKLESDEGLARSEGLNPDSPG